MPQHVRKNAATTPVNSSDKSSINLTWSFEPSHRDKIIKDFEFGIFLDFELCWFYGLVFVSVLVTLCLFFVFKT